MKVVIISFLAFLGRAAVDSLTACLHTISQSRAGKRRIGVDMEITPQRISPGSVLEGELSGLGDWVKDRESKTTGTDKAIKVEKEGWKCVERGKKKAEEWEDERAVGKQTKPWSQI